MKPSQKIDPVNKTNKGSFHGCMTVKVCLHFLCYAILMLCQHTFFKELIYNGYM